MTLASTGIAGLASTFGLLTLLPTPQVLNQTNLGPREELSGFCAPQIDDASGAGCLAGSSVPTLGMLYPMTTWLNVDAATNNVGIGTTSPSQRLHVIGNELIGGDLLFNDDIDGIQFSSDDGNLFGGPTPMISMFEDGISNPDRMVISHSPGFVDWGLEYSDSADDMRFRSTAGTALTIGLGSRNVTVEEGILTAKNSDATESTLSVQSDVILNTSTNLVDLVSPTGGFFTYDFFECRSSAGDVEFRINSAGNLYADGALFAPADFAEMIRVSHGAASVEAGDLMVIDPTGERSIVKSTSARSTLVAGVYSTKPGFVGSEREGDVLEVSGERKELDLDDMAELYDEIPMAVVGIVPVKASAENGAIRPGDLLVSSNTPGHVMADATAPNGTVVGKALSSLDSGTGVIKMLVTLQ